jgi:hypothetical protein
MKIIKVSASGGEKLAGLLLRQTPGGNGIWKNCKFIVNEPVKNCDWWFVCHGSGLSEKESTCCPPDHVVYISMEPTEGVSGCKSEFIAQFPHVVMTDRNFSHKHITYSNGMTWWAGIHVVHDGMHHFNPVYRYGYDQFMAMDGIPDKKNKFSLIVSQKTSLPGHRKRLEFVEKLMNHPISEFIDVYGSGHRQVEDKWDAIAPYKYHIVLENNVIPDYWSEKLGDAYLGFSYPIYYGCPNILKYFDNKSLQIIEINKFDDVVNKLESILRSDVYDERYESIKSSRMKILNDYNIFELMDRLSKNNEGENKKVVLKPNSDFEDIWLKRIARQVKRMFF